MRIAYVVQHHLGSPSGVLDKILGQAAQWEARGHCVKLFGLTADGSSAVPPTTASECASIETFLSRFLTLPALFRDAVFWRPDLIYIRYLAYQPGLDRLLAVAPVIVEVNSDDTADSRLLPWNTRLLYNLLTRSRILRRASAFVFVTNELAYSPSFARFAMTRSVVGNGINLADTRLRARAPDNDRPRLFFIGSGGSPWHGLDKILLLAALRPGWWFDVVGPADALSRDLPANIACHGQMTVEQYSPLLAGADVAIATLGLHRKRLQEASPLKTRKYLAAGVPTILAYRDTDFLRGAPFLLQLPNVEDNILPQIGRIDEFVQRMRGVIVPRSSVAHLDWSKKEPARLAFFQHVVETSRRTRTSC